MLDFGVTGKLLAQASGTNYATIYGAFLTDAIVNFLVLNGGSTVNGARGFMFDSQVTNMSEDQAIGNVIYQDFELIPVYSGNAPQSALVTTGAPVFTAF